MKEKLTINTESKAECSSFVSFLLSALRYLITVINSQVPQFGLFSTDCWLAPKDLKTALWQWCGSSSREEQVKEVNGGSISCRNWAISPVRSCNLQQTIRQQRLKKKKKKRTARLGRKHHFLRFWKVSMKRRKNTVLRFTRRHIFGLGPENWRRQQTRHVRQMKKEGRC